MRSSSSFITLIRQMSTCRLLSTQNLTLLLHLRSGSICSGTLPNPWEGERWIITQVLFGYGLDVTSIPCPVLSAEQRAPWSRVLRRYCGLYCFCHWQFLQMSKLFRGIFLADNKLVSLQGSASQVENYRSRPGSHCKRSIWISF